MHERDIQRRIARAEETKAALARVTAERSTENVAAFHRLHAEHLREDGDPEGAKRAEARADRVEDEASRHAEPAGG